MENDNELEPITDDQALRLWMLTADQEGALFEEAPLWLSHAGFRQGLVRLEGGRWLLTKDGWRFRDELMGEA